MALKQLSGGQKTLVALALIFAIQVGRHLLLLFVLPVAAYAAGGRAPVAATHTPLCSAPVWRPSPIPRPLPELYPCAPVPAPHSAATPRPSTSLMRSTPRWTHSTGVRGGTAAQAAAPCHERLGMQAPLPYWRSELEVLLSSCSGQRHRLLASPHAPHPHSNPRNPAPPTVAGPLWRPCCASRPPTPPTPPSSSSPPSTHRCGLAAWLAGGQRE